jgi:iron(III) transport system ATP-binding protein
MIAGLIEPTDGEIRVDGKLLSAPGGKMVPPERRNMGMVFQSYAVWPHMKVFENVAFPLHNLKKSKDEIRRRVRATLDMVKLGGFEDRYPSHLSGGQQQRVALARAMAIEPDILLFDEPLSNLDAKLREEMRFELKEIQRRLGVTSIYVTHDQAEAMAISDRIAVLSRGKIKQVGKPSEIYDSPQDPFTAEFIGLANLLPAKVIGESTVRLAGGEELDIGQCRPLPLDADVVVSIRPHNVGMRRESAGKRNELRGTVEKGSYLGDKVDYRVRIGERILRVQTAPEELYPEGAQVFLHLPDARISVI